MGKVVNLLKLTNEPKEHSVGYKSVYVDGMNECIELQFSLARMIPFQT